MNSIFCLHPRCGSTVICLCLQYSCNLNVWHEPNAFNNSVNYDVVKIISTNLCKETNKKFLRNSDKIIFLYRESLIDAIISEYFSQTFRTKDNIQIWNTLFNDKISDHDKKLFLKTSRTPMDIHLIEQKIII